MWLTLPAAVNVVAYIVVEPLPLATAIISTLWYSLALLPDVLLVAYAPNLFVEPVR